ncbi:MAG: HD domain-containing protein [Dehalococcoidia bacterium]
MSPPAGLLAALADPDPAGALRDLDADGRLTPFFPELEAGRGFVQPVRHHYDVLGHNLAAVAALGDALGLSSAGVALRETLGWMDMDEALGGEIDGLPVRLLLRLSTLLHDVGKPAQATYVDGALKFPRHGPRGAEMMRERLPELGFGPAATDFVARMIRYHLRPGELVKAWPPTDHAIRRFVNDLDGRVLPLMLVNLADGWATRGPGYTEENFRRHCGFVNYVAARAWAVVQPGDPPLVTGEELMTTFDLEGGRTLGTVLKAVRAAQDGGHVRDREAALALARELLADGRPDDAATPHTHGR